MRTVSQTTQKMATLAVLPHPASSRLNRALAHEILEHTVRHTLSTLYIVLIDDNGVVPAWKRRNEEIAIYNEVHNMCVSVGRPAIDMIVVPTPTAAVSDTKASVPTQLDFDVAYGLVEHQNIATTMSSRSFSSTASAPTSSTSPSTTSSTAPTPPTAQFIPLNNEKPIAAFLVHDYFMYEDDSQPLPTYNLVAMGGTFDNLHAGHKRLLTAASHVCTGTLTIGVTSDAYLAKKQKAFGNMIEPLATRLEKVRRFLQVIKPSLTVEAIGIDDGCGPTITRPEFQAIVASSETLSGCRYINGIRTEQHDWSPLEIVIVARTDESNLSSTSIRKWKSEQEQEPEQVPRNIAQTPGKM